MPAEQDYIQTYDGTLDGDTLSRRYFRIQEGAIVKFLCPLKYGGDINTLNNDDHVDMYWTFGGQRIGKRDGFNRVDGMRLDEHAQMYQSDGLEFTAQTAKRVAVMVYTARKEDNLKKVTCQLSDEQAYDSVEINSNARSEIYLLVLRKYRLNIYVI